MIPKFRTEKECLKLVFAELVALGLESAATRPDLPQTRDELTHSANGGSTPASALYWLRTWTFQIARGIGIRNRSHHARPPRESFAGREAAGMSNRIVAGFVAEMSVFARAARASDLYH